MELSTSPRRGRGRPEGPGEGAAEHCDERRISRLNNPGEGAAEQCRASAIEVPWHWWEVFRKMKQFADPPEMSRR
jgi:hypothetical protein